MKHKRICKKHIGHAIDFRNTTETGLINGHIIKVQNGIAVIEHGIDNNAELYTMYLPVRSERIVEIY